MDMEARYDVLYARFAKDLKHALRHDRYGYNLTGVDLTRKSDACSELTLLQALQYACQKENVDVQLYKWCIARMHELYLNGLCW